MEVEVTFLERRGSAVMRRSRRIDARRLRLGRGTGNEVQLPDIRVDLAAAALFPRSGVMTIEALGPTSLRVNGHSTRRSSIAPGDEILIGPYRIQLAEPPPGCDAALNIELFQPFGDTLERLVARAGTGLEAKLVGKRSLSWAGFLAVLIIFLLVPIAAYLHQQGGDTRSASRSAVKNDILALWEPGKLTNAHRFFGADCATCHSALFARVSEDACAECHKGSGNHIELAAAGKGMQHVLLEAGRCTDCHREHRDGGMVVNDSRLCLGCHRSLAETVPAAGLPNVTSFPSGHPQFRATVVVNSAGPQVERFPLGPGAAPRERPGIKFSHAAHLVPGGFPALGYQPMACGDCHVPRLPEGYWPITYTRQCEGCHGLQFERQDLPWPKGKVPHGDDAAIVAAVWNFYAGKLVQGGIAEPPQPAIRRSGTGLAVPAAAAETDAQAWVTAKTETALRTIILDNNRGCAYCHFGRGPDGAFDLSGLAATIGAVPSNQAPPPIVAPVRLSSRFLPHSRFNHAKHTGMQCELCHDTRRADDSSAVMIPSIETCGGCHGSEGIAARAESTCMTCHRFHSEPNARVRSPVPPKS